MKQSVVVLTALLLAPLTALHAAEPLLRQSASMKRDAIYWH